MMTTLILLTLAQTLSPSRIDISIMEPLGLLEQPPPPRSVTVELTGIAGAWTATIGGPLATAGAYGGSPITVTPSSGTGPATLTIAAPQALTFSMTAATPLLRGTVTIGSAVLDIQFSIKPRTRFPVVNQPTSGCTTTDSRFPTNDNCTAPTTGMVPAVGATYANIYGGTIRRLNIAAPAEHHYSARQDVSLDEQYVLLNNGGAVGIYQLSDGSTPFGTSLPGPGATAMISQWSGDTSGTYYYLPRSGSSRGQLHKVVPGVSDTVIADICIAPYSVDCTVDQDGGATAGMKGSWLVMGARDTGVSTPLASDRICAVDVSTTPAGVFCTAAGELSSRISGGIDWCGISSLGRLGDRWVACTGYPVAVFYRVTPTGLAFSHKAGSWDGTEQACVSSCFSTPHAAFGLDERGDVIIMAGPQRAADNFIRLTAYRVLDGPIMMRHPREFIAQATNAGVIDNHYSCSDEVRRCSVSMYSAGASPPTNWYRQLLVVDFNSQQIIAAGHIPTEMPPSLYAYTPRCTLYPRATKAICNIKWGSTSGQVYEVTLP